MIRRTLKLAAAAIITAVAFASFAEAAPPKRIRHRVKHARGATYRTATPPPVAKAKKKTPKRKAAAKAHHATATTANHPPPPPRRKPSTKPR